MSRLSANDCPSGAIRPRIGLIVVDDGLYTHRWAAALLADRELDVVSVACLSPFQAVHFNPHGARGFWSVTRARAAYYGLSVTMKFAAKWAVAAVAGWRFRMGLGGAPGSVASAARASGIEVIRPCGGDVHHPAFLDRLAACEPDLLVCAFSQHADSRLLHLPRLGCLNVHFSLLPRHRGREPLFHAMLAGEGAGVSVHWMAPEIDAGAVVVQESLDVRADNTLHELILTACGLAAKIVPRAVRIAIEGGPQVESAGILPLPAPWPSKADVAAFRAHGLRFV